MEGGGGGGEVEEGGAANVFRELGGGHLRIQILYSQDLSKSHVFLFTRNVLPIIQFLTFLSKKVLRKCKFWPNLFSEGRLVFVKHFLLPSVLDKGIDD